MIDKYVTRIKVDNTTNIQDRLEHSYHIGKSVDGRNRYKGRIRNIEFYILENSYITISGSIAKFYKGTNLETLTRTEVSDAFEYLSELLNWSLGKEKVHYFEFGTNFTLKCPVNTYQDLLLDCPNYLRNTHGTRANYTTYYENTMREMVIYDKIAKLKKEQRKKDYMPESLPEGYIMRMELRYGSLTKNFPNESITVNTLSDIIFFNKVLKSYEDIYENIFKTKQKLLPTMNVIGIRNCKNCLASLALQDEQILNATYNSLKSPFVTKDQRKDVRKMIRSLRGADSHLIEHDLISELSEKVKAAVQFYRQ